MITRHFKADKTVIVPERGVVELTSSGGNTINVVVISFEAIEKLHGKIETHLYRRRLAGVAEGEVETG